MPHTIFIFLITLLLKLFLKIETTVATPINQDMEAKQTPKINNLEDSAVRDALNPPKSREPSIKA